MLCNIEVVMSARTRESGEYAKKKKDLNGNSYVGTIQHMVVTRTQEECAE